MLAESSIHYLLTGLLIAVAAGLFVDKFKPTTVFAGAVFVLLLTRISSIEEVISGFANSSILTLFVLIFLTSALRRNVNILGWFDRVIGTVSSPRKFVFAMSAWVAPLSAFVNNTPIVALLIPYVYTWSKKRGMSPSKFLIPLTYAATLGGTITVIGTSTHLVLNGFLTSNGYEALGFWDFAPIGLALTFFGILYLGTLGMNLLPERKDIMAKFSQSTREYIVETKLSATNEWLGKTVEEAGLRNLEGLFLIEINRGGEVISPVAPTEELQSDDLLYFAGETELVVKLIQESNGLELPKNEKFNLGENLDVIEVLLPATSELAGKRVKDSNFRERFDAAIIAIHRNGKRIGGKIGEVTLAYGDLLLLSAGEGFSEAVKDQKDLYTVSSPQKLKKKNPKALNAFLGLSVLLLVPAIVGYWPLLVALGGMLGVAMALKLYTFEELKTDLNMDLLLILVASLALGSALINTGTAEWMTRGLMISLENQPAWIVITGIFVTTVLITSFVTNVAAVAIMFPVVSALVEGSHFSGMQASSAFLALAYGASAAFLTPVSYQTNLMVYGPGGYTNKDFFRVGFPLTILYSVICILMISLEI
ncbi:MAG: SLC13 family permease [Schleiferiaceae bacterium]